MTKAGKIDLKAMQKLVNKKTMPSTRNVTFDSAKRKILETTIAYIGCTLACVTRNLSETHDRVNSPNASTFRPHLYLLPAALWLAACLSATAVFAAAHVPTCMY